MARASRQVEVDLTLKEDNKNDEVSKPSPFNEVKEVFKDLWDKHNAQPIKDPYLARALKHLEEPADQDWTRDNRYILAARRPMRNYPLIMISPSELAEVIRIFEETIPDTKLWRRVFLKTETQLQTYLASRKSIQSINAFNWLTGWCMDSVLETATKDQRLKNGGRRYQK